MALLVGARAAVFLLAQMIKDWLAKGPKLPKDGLEALQVNKERYLMLAAVAKGSLLFLDHP